MKGAVFTIIAIVLAANLLFFYVKQHQYSELERSKVIASRIRSMDTFMHDIEQDVDRGLYISAIRSLIGVTEYVAENGSFLSDFNQSFNEAMLNGTINGEIINITKDANFGTWIDKIADIGAKLDLDISFIGLNVYPYQDDPWNVKINVHGILNMSDRKGLASWYRNINLTTTIDILEFEDPLYTIVSGGKFTNKIILSNLTDFVNGADATNLKKQINNSWYIASPLAPSYLMRIAGNLNPSPYGIESIVNVPALQAAAPELYVAGSSSVDYIYFGNNTLSNCQVNQTISGMSWFRLDNPHLAVYEASCI